MIIALYYFCYVFVVQHQIKNHMLMHVPPLGILSPEEILPAF